MKKLLLAACCLLVAHTASLAQDKDVFAIRHMLIDQVAAWNSGSIDGYMKGYWDSDSLLFIGSKGPRYGYQAILKRYKEAYPDTAHMGKLTTHIKSMERLSDDYFFIVGTWALARKAGDVDGSYTLLVRRIKGEWLIVCEHSS